MRGNRSLGALLKTPAAKQVRVYLLTTIAILYYSFGALLARHEGQIGGSYISLNEALPVDPSLSIASQAWLAEPCFLGATKCPVEVIETASATRLRKAANKDQLLIPEYRRFDNGLQVLEYLAIRGLADPVVQLSNDSVFVRNFLSGRSLIYLATKYYLRPAMRLAERHRESDAIRLFSNYNAIVGNQTSRGFWLSNIGLDLTDVPTIASAFCDAKSANDEKICLLGLLLALNKPASIPDSISDREVFCDGTKLYCGTGIFSSGYDSLPAALRVAELSTYLHALDSLRLGSTDGARAIASQHNRFRSGDASELLWRYLELRVTLRQAELSNNSKFCMDAYSQLREIDEWISTSSISHSPILEATRRKANLADSICG